MGGVVNLIPKGNGMNVHIPEVLLGHIVFNNESSRRTIYQLSYSSFFTSQGDFYILMTIKPPTIPMMIVFK